jgi:hypothetical protein
MPCQPYKDALIEAAASGTEPQGGLRAHLAACADCRAAFEQERSLFASIDAGLHAAANTDVPVSLLPRVRARLDEEPAPRRVWATNWFVLASAAVMVVAFFAARSAWRSNPTSQPGEIAQKPVVPASSQGRGLAVQPSLEKKDLTNNQLFIAKSHSAPRWLGKGHISPEVLVPHDQELLLAEYAEQWSLHKHPLLVAQKFDATILSPLYVEPIQIDELGVKLLAEEKLR